MCIPLWLTHIHSGCSILSCLLEGNSSVSVVWSVPVIQMVAKFPNCWMFGRLLHIRVQWHEMGEIHERMSPNGFQGMVLRCGGCIEKCLYLIALVGMQHLKKQLCPGGVGSLILLRTTSRFSGMSTDSNVWLICPHLRINL